MNAVLVNNIYEIEMSHERGNLYDKGKRGMSMPFTCVHIRYTVFFHKLSYINSWKVVEYERTPRLQPTITHRPLSAFSIRDQTDTTNNSVSSSDDDENLPTQLRRMVPIASNIMTFRLVQHVETPSGIALDH